MSEEKREYQEPPEVAPEPTPTITPDMIQTTFKMLETRGAIHYHKGGIYVPTEKGWKLLMKVEYDREEIIGYGHPDIVATHPSEIEITKSSSPDKNSAIIAVSANKSCKDFSSGFKKALRDGKGVGIEIEAGEFTDNVNAFGSPSLELNDKENIVITKTDNVGDKTVSIMADKAAFELKRELINNLKNPEIKVKITLEVKP